MGTGINTKARTVSKSDIQHRGRALQHRFRMAGIPQYTRWFADVSPGMKGDATAMHRIRLLFNGQGSMDDLALLEKCEVLAALHLNSKAA
jgi:hypothetical protein